MSTTEAAPTAAQTVDQWLARCDEALTSEDPAAAAELFAEDGFWRGPVAFTPNITTVEGPADVQDMLEHTLADTRPSDWRTTEEPTEAGGVTEAWLAFAGWREWPSSSVSRRRSSSHVSRGDHREGRHHLRVAALPDHARVPDPAL